MMQHLVQPGETGLFILQLCGYRTLDVVPAVLALNGLSSIENIPAGQTLLIPRQTPTPGPTDDPNATPVAEAEAAEPPVGATSPSVQGGDPENRVDSTDGRYWVHTVREGETIASIARAYDSAVPCILQNNNFTSVGESISGLLYSVYLMGVDMELGGSDTGTNVGCILGTQSACAE